jgi:hypothetical protein
MTITLFVGDCTEYLAIEATKFDASAQLLDFSNFKEYLAVSNTHATFYTSVADLPKISRECTVFYEVLQKADKIYYRPPKIWSDHSTDFSLQNQQQITEYFLYLTNRDKHNVNGLNLSEYTNTSYLNLQNPRIINDRQLWVAGCSVTAGVGVDNKDRYPTLLAKKFNLTWSDLSRGGSSIEFQADQILRSNVQKNDIVLWGLTSEYRATIWNETLNKIEFINPHTFDHVRTKKADNVCDETRLYKAMISVKQVINFCDKIKAPLIIVPIMCTKRLQLMLHQESSYYQLPYPAKPFDLGTDNMHPGPIYHQWYASCIGEFFEKVLNT